MSVRASCAHGCVRAWVSARVCVHACVCTRVCARVCAFVCARVVCVCARARVCIRTRVTPWRWCAPGTIMALACLGHPSWLQGTLGPSGASMPRAPQLACHGHPSWHARHPGAPWRWHHLTLFCVYFPALTPPKPPPTLQLTFLLFLQYHTYKDDVEKGMVKVSGDYHPYVSVGRPCDWDALTVSDDEAAN